MQIRTELKQTQISYGCDNNDCFSKANYSCQLCKKDLCSVHVKFDDRDYYDDYPGKYCTACWDAGVSYRQRIVDIQTKADLEVDKINAMWTQDCK